MAQSTGNAFGNLQGQIISRYKLENFLGSGAMADVYKSTHPELKRDVAVKILHPHRTRLPGFVERFRHEAAASAALIHPNIIQVYDFDVTENNLYYMVMQYINGPSLEEYLSIENEALSLLKTYKFLTPIASALQHAHQQGTIHRDVKPGNIMLNTRESAFLGDFGLAKIIGVDLNTDSGLGPGTPSYMAPEQIENRNITPAVDIYALGMVLYKMLTGRLPFDDDSLMSIIFRKATESAPPPSKFNPAIPAEVDDVILKAVAREPKARYGDAYLLTVAYHNAISKYVDHLPELSAVTSSGFIPLPRVDVADYKIQREFTGEDNDIYKRYLAHNMSLDIPAVLTILSASETSNPDLVDKFQTRLEKLALIDHPTIVPFTRSDWTTDKRPFVTYEFIDGRSLHTKLEEWSQPSSALSVAEAITLIRQVAEALKVAHKEDLIHQELITQNIIISPDKSPALIGLEIPATPSVHTLTLNQEDPGYIPPEQYAGDEINAASNIYSLSVMLYELLSGHRPRMSMWDLIGLAPEDIPRAIPIYAERAGFTAETHTFLGKCLTTNKTLRYQNMESFLADLEKVAAAEETGIVAPPIIFAPPPLPPPTPVTSRLNRPESLPELSKRDRRWLYFLPLLLLIPLCWFIGGLVFSPANDEDAFLTPTTAVTQPATAENEAEVIVIPPTATGTASATTTATQTQTATPSRTASPSPSATKTPTITTTASTTSSSTPTIFDCPQPPGWVAYRVQQGDSFSALSTATRTTVERLLEANCTDGSVLSIGQRLWLPFLPATAVPTAGPVENTPNSTSPPASTATESPPNSTNPSPPTEPPAEPTRTPPVLPSRTPPSP